jgi:hypothetical protein
MRDERRTATDVLAAADRPRPGALATAVAVFALDLLLIGLIAAVGVLIVNGPGIYEPFGIRLKLRTANNPVSIAVAVALVRVGIGSPIPIFRSRRLASWLRDAANRASSIASGAAPIRTQTFVLLCVVVSGAARLFQAWRHAGFVTGDDVEIHEMTLGALWSAPWPVWDLRSAFYPMTFVYPLQALARSLGADDVHTLVFAGRAVVGVLSAAAIWLVWVAGKRLGGLSVGVMAAALLAISKLQVGYGSTELPRPVAATLLASAFVLVLSPGGWRAAGAGALIGCAAALRFSEAVFVLPAGLYLWLSGRRRDAAALAALAATAAIAITAVADAAYWGEPLRSVRRAWDYTLADRLSSRGFQPVHYYLSALQHWTNWIIAGFACVAWRMPAARPALIWTVLPIAVLSALPHKENRYLVPVIPFLAIAAAVGISRVARSVAQRSSLRHRYVFATLLLAAVLYEVGEWRLRRSDDAVVLARYVRERDAIGGVAVEQLWRAGGMLHLSGRRTLVDLTPETVLSAAQSGDVSWLLLHIDTVNRHQFEPMLAAAGWRRHSSAGEYLLFER